MGPGLHTIPFYPKGQSTSKGDSYVAQYRLVTPDYFRALKIPLRQGRAFDAHDKADRTPVAIVNETLASRFFPKGDAVGAQIKIDDNNSGPRPLEIVGVVGDVKHASLEEKPTIDVYLALAQVHEDSVGAVTNSQYWILRSNTDPQSVEAAIRRELRSVDAEVASASIRTMESYLSDSVAPRRFNLRLLTIFSVAALLLAATGIYGLISYSVAQRTPEIGIRLALGATRKNIFRMILGQGFEIGAGWTSARFCWRVCIDAPDSKFNVRCDSGRPAHIRRRLFAPDLNYPRGRRSPGAEGHQTRSA